MEAVKKTAKEKQMAAAFLLGGSKYFDSLLIKMANTFMISQEDHYHKSVTDAYNLILHFKDNTGQTH